MSPDPLHRSRLRWVALAATTTLAGCVLTAEPVNKPNLPLPDSLPAPPGATVELPDPWWSIFGDETLDALVREALANNANAAVAAARVEEARALARISRADRLPSLELQAGATRAKDSSLVQPGLPGAGATRTEHYAQGVVAYEVDLWGRYAQASSAARQRFFASQFDRDALRLSLTGETVRAYHALAAAQGQLAAARETLASRDESLRLERLRFEGGESDEITFRRVEAEVAGARAAVANFEYDVESRASVLGVLLGRTPRELVERPVAPRENALQADLPRLPPGVPAQVLERRPDVRAAEAQLVAAAADVGSARAALFPGISLTGAYGAASLELGDLFTDPSEAWSIAGSLLQPVFEGGRLRGNLDRQRALQQQRRADYARTVQGAFREVLDGLQGQASLRDVLAARALQVDALRRATELAELRYAEGEIAYLDLLDVRRGLFAAQIELVEARRVAYANTVDLALALGGGPTPP